MDFEYDLYAADGDGFSSSAFEYVAYSRPDKKMVVGFYDGGDYLYSDVEESTYHVFINADSLGRFYQKNISGTFKSERVDGVFLTERECEETESVDDVAGWTSELSLAGVYNKYGVKYLTQNGIYAEPTYQATSEDQALELFNSELEAAQRVAPSGTLDNVRIVSVTRYFD